MMPYTLPQKFIIQRHEKRGSNAALLETGRYHNLEVPQETATQKWVSIILLGLFIIVAIVIIITGYLANPMYKNKNPLKSFFKD